MFLLCAPDHCDSSTTSSPAIGLQRQSAFFNNTGTTESNIVLPNLLIDLQKRLQFSFRSCHSGQLVYQESGNGENSIAIEIDNLGKIKLIFRFENNVDQVQMSTDRNLLDNQWYSLDILFEIGVINVIIEQGRQRVESLFVSNSTFRSYLWTLDLSGSNGVIVGRNYTGCIQQGIGLSFDSVDTQVSGDVRWDVCLQPSSVGSCGEYCFPCVKHLCLVTAVGVS